MTTTDSYLAALERELADVDPGVREELLRGIEEELAGLSASDAEARLRALGDPAFVAASVRSEAQMTRGTPPRQDAPWYSVVTVLLASIGGFVVPVLGWVVGLIMLWASASWTLRHKVVGTVLTLAGPAGFMFALLPAFTVGEVMVSGPSAQNPLLPSGFGTPWWSIAAIVVLAVGWIAGWIWLLAVAERARRR